MILRQYGSKYEINDGVDGVLEISGDYVYATVTIPCAIEITGAFCHVHCANNCTVSLRSDRADNVIKVKAGTVVYIDGQKNIAVRDGHHMVYEGKLTKCVRCGNEWVCSGELEMDYGTFRVYKAYRDGKEKKIFEKEGKIYNFVSAEETYHDFEIKESEKKESYEEMCMRIRLEGKLGITEFRRITGCCYNGVMKYMTRWGKQRDDKVDIHESLIRLGNDRELIERVIGTEEFRVVKEKYILAVRGMTV